MTSSSILDWAPVRGAFKHTVLCMFQLRLLAATLLRLLSQHLNSQ